MRVVVTGAKGMVGKAMVQRLLERGDDVVALTRDVAGCPQHWLGRVDCRAVGYERESLRSALHGADAVIHLAAARPTPQAEAAGYRAYADTNVAITEELLRTAAEEGVATFCQASSISVYSPANALPYRETDYPWPASHYGLSKVVCEQLANLISQRTGIRAVSLRLARVLGQDDCAGSYMLMKFIRLAREGRPLTIFGEGNDGRDTVYVKDVVGAFESALAADAVAGVFNIGGGRSFFHREIAEAINEVFGNTGNLVHDHSWRDTGESFFMDCSRAELDLGWQRRWTLRSGLEDMRRAYADDARPVTP